MDWAISALTIIVVFCILLALAIKLQPLIGWLQYKYNVYIWERDYVGSPEYLETIKQEEEFEAASRLHAEQQYQEQLAQDKLHANETIPYPWSSEVLADEQGWNH